MVVQGKRRKTQSPRLAPSIVARLAGGWQLDTVNAAFVEEKTATQFDVGRRLPHRTRIEERFVSDAQDEPEVYVQFVFPPRSHVRRHLKKIQAWAMVEEAYINPSVSLPE